MKSPEIEKYLKDNLAEKHSFNIMFFYQNKKPKERLMQYIVQNKF